MGDPEAMPTGPQTEEKAPAGEDHQEHANRQ
jgi:hypothetical protein